MKIGFTTGHNESIPRDVWTHEKDFNRFLKFLTQSGIQCEKIVLLDDMPACSAIIIGAPEAPFSDRELSALRKFVKSGGDLLIVQKKGGDKYNRVVGGRHDDQSTNIGNLFPGIRPNNDEILDPEYNGETGSRPETRPLMDISLAGDELHFKGTICYDGGCSYQLEEEVDISIFPDGNAVSRAGPGYNSNRDPKFYYDGGEDKPGAIFVYKKIGKGSVMYWGSRWSFSDEDFLLEYDNWTFFSKIMRLLLGEKVFVENLAERMDNVQRHRLLHGFPMSSGMKEVERPENFLADIELDHSKELAVGVIPHPMCTHRCSFCPFPHEPYNKKKQCESVRAIIDELESVIHRHGELGQRKVSSLYFGGGTANLTSKENLEYLCKGLKKKLNIGTHTEITLEGAPRFFVLFEDLLDVLEDHFPDSTLRCSLGVQTFDQEILKSANRSIMNKEGSVEEAVKILRDRNIKISFDLMFNLPQNQTYAQIKADLDRAIDLGIEHICWYHLVAFEGLDTKWSRDEDILNSLPSRKSSLSNAIKLYEELNRRGYIPTTVTDFKKKDSGRRGDYIYEEDLRDPERVDWWGLGPYAISVFTDKHFQRGIKLLNPNGLDRYLNKQKRNGIAWEKVFDYEAKDLQIYWITRKIKGTIIDRLGYKKLFGKDIEQDHGLELQALMDIELLVLDNDKYRLTPKGFFFSDSIAGLIAWIRVSELVTRSFDGTIVRVGTRRTRYNHRGRGGDWNYAGIEWMG